MSGRPGQVDVLDVGCFSAHPLIVKIRSTGEGLVLALLGAGDDDECCRVA